MFSIEEVRENNRARLLISSFAAHIAAMALVLTMVLGPSTASAGKGGSGGSSPRNFRVAAKTAYTVTLAWDTRTSNSGDFNYHVWGVYNVGPTVILPKTATSYTFTALYPGNFLHLRHLYQERQRERLRPGHPQRHPSAKRHHPAHYCSGHLHRRSRRQLRQHLLDTCAGRGPHLSTQIYLNGTFHFGVDGGITNATLRFLRPDTTYSLTARAIDFGYNVGPFSDRSPSPPRRPIPMTTPRRTHPPV
jgi:hypothetical protein